MLGFVQTHVSINLHCAYTTHDICVGSFLLYQALMYVVGFTDFTALHTQALDNLCTAHMRQNSAHLCTPKIFSWLHNSIHLLISISLSASHECSESVV